MYQLIETIQIRNGKFIHLIYHQARMNMSIQRLFNKTNSIELIQAIPIPEEAKSGIWKCRIVYSLEIEEISFTPYAYKTIESLQIIESPSADYSFKLLDRSMFAELLEKKQHSDEILITKNGYITDTSYTNIIFYDGIQWVTPHTYLLPGTQRTYLLETKQIIEKEITIQSLSLYTKARLINCFYDLKKGNEILISNIYI